MKKHYKQYAATVSEIAPRKMSFRISTASVDRDGDTVDPNGWQLDNYMKNPVVLWAHDYSQLPVGKATNIVSTKDGLSADVEFLPEGKYPFADLVHDMVKDGFLNATSVGFAGTEFDRSKERQHGYDFKKQELLEFSIVPVPSNPEALVQRGLETGKVQKYAKAMREWSHEVLGEQAPKLDDEQFDSLADAIAKAMREQPPSEKKADDKKVEELKPAEQLDLKAIAEEVAKILKDSQPISQDIIDIQSSEPEIDWSAIPIEEKTPEFEFALDPQEVTDLLLASVKDAFREMAGSQARAAINHMTGRLD